MELEELLKQYGLGKRWVWLLGSLGVTTLSDLQPKINTPSFQNALFDNVKASEVENLCNFIHQGSVRPEITGARGALTQLLEKDRAALAGQQDKEVLQHTIEKAVPPKRELHPTKSHESEPQAAPPVSSKGVQNLKREDSVPSSSKPQGYRTYKDHPKADILDKYFKQERPKAQHPYQHDASGEDAEDVSAQFRRFVGDTNSLTSLEGITARFDRIVPHDRETAQNDQLNIAAEFERLLLEDTSKIPSRASDEGRNASLVPEDRSDSLKSDAREEQQIYTLVNDSKEAENRDSQSYRESRNSREFEQRRESHSPTDSRDPQSMESENDSRRSRKKLDSHSSENRGPSDFTGKKKKSQKFRTGNESDYSVKKKRMSKILELAETTDNAEDSGRDAEDPTRFYKESYSQLQKSASDSEFIDGKLPLEITTAKSSSQIPVSNSSCLEVYLRNIGIDPDKYGTSFFRAGIHTLKELQDYVSGKRNLSEICNQMNGTDEVFVNEIVGSTLDWAVEHEELLNSLGLLQYFPEKITLQTTMAKAVDKLETMSDVPWYFLSKIMMLDYRSRDDILPADATNPSLADDNSSATHGEALDDILDDMFSKISDEPSNTSSSLGPHPLDIIVLIFQCSSNFLRQILCEKMFMCKLSIPLVLPPFLYGEPLFMLWSLRNVIIGTLNCSEVSWERSLVNCPIPLVSCLKMGNVIRSKSKLLNEILNGQSHETYFHRDCKNGMMNKSLSNGLIEFAMCLPSSKDIPKGQVNKTVTFVNLRGDAQSRSAVSEFLLRISNVVLVMVDIIMLRDVDVLKSLKYVTTAVKETILIISKDPNAPFDNTCREAIKDCLNYIGSESFKSENIILDFTRSGEKNIKELKDETVAKINKSLDRIPTYNSLESYKEVAEELKITVDEDVSECRGNQNQVIELMQDVKKGKIESAKMDLLPLQCKPWQEWAKLNKEEHRLQKKPKGSVVNYIAHIHTEKEKRRDKQREYLENPSNMFSVFLNNFLQKKGNNLHYYIKWIKFYLDDISRETIPTLMKEYSMKWDEMCQYESNNVPKDLQNELSSLENKIADSSFGLEHIMREFGQVYEALFDTQDGTMDTMKAKALTLPKIMASMLLSGYPLELMDGDASHVPVQWIKAVLQELENLIGREKKIFVLSVLGIQSSGKSTLLNTMFGLQFAVAAGRCTRGVYAQLVPVNNENGDKVYDYILVVDTEGLRAAELGSVKLEHDNEIATFVIGLGDVTLVNIKGENVAEMQDVLQIVVHAILKMKLVNKSLKLQPSCLFIHQNVSAPDAAQKMKTGQQKFMETLDKVTKAAGQQEDKPDYCKVKQVIDIDINKNIWYFSDLWKGDPPMAPANPGYSEKVNAVKKMLLNDIMKARSYHLTLSKLCAKLEDLWNGILKENFVFNFKNSLEMKAYRSLETKRSDLSWFLRNQALKWLNNKNIVIQSHEYDLEGLEKSLIQECEQHLKNEYNEAERTLMEFFEKNEDRELLEQWRNNSMLKLKEIYDEILRNTKKRLSNSIQIRNRQMDKTKDTHKYKEEMLNRVTELAEDCRKCSNLEDEILEEKFNQMWNDWVMKLLADCENDDVDIYENVKNVLLNEFSMDQSLLLKSFDKYLLERIKKNFRVAIEDNVSDEVKKNDQGKRRTTTAFKPVKQPSVETDPQERKQTNIKRLNVIIDKLIQWIESTCETMDVQSVNEMYARSLLDIVDETVSEIENSTVIIKSTEDLCTKLSVYACQLASYKCSQKHKLKTQKSRETTNMNCHIAEIEVHSIFKDALNQRLTDQHNEVHQELHKSCLPLAGNVSDFIIDMETHVSIDKNLMGNNKISDAVCRQAAEELVKNLLEKVRAHVEETDLEGFKDEYAVEIIRYVDSMIKETEKSKQNFHFTKTFKTEMSVHVCQSAIPKFFEKHKRYFEKVNPRLIFERDYKETYLEMFKNIYKQSGYDEAFADILSQHLCKVIANTVDKDMPRKLADDVRTNVEEIQRKSALLPSVLGKLLDVDTFKEYQLYLTDIQLSIDKWIAYYVNNYVFRMERSGKTRYVAVASEALEFLISRVCQRIEEAVEAVYEQKGELNIFQLWIKEFQQRLSGELPLKENDISSLAEGYRIVDLTSFAKKLIKNITDSVEKLCEIFSDHTDDHLASAHDDSVYSLIAQECKGCTERCPFCSAPCSLSARDHIEQNMKHSALEHYPLACAGIRWGDNNRLLIENCAVQVASDQDFENKETNFKPHPYKEYMKIYPDWYIDGDVSVEASLYWKRFLVKYGSQLAEKYGADMPDIPQGWRTITIDKVRNSLRMAAGFECLMETSAC